MKTNFLGLKMESPVILAAGPWSRDGRSIRQGLAAGAGAVITETIVSDAVLDVRPRIAHNGFGTQNIRMYSDIQVEGWERELFIAKSGGGFVIASISAHTPSELAYLAIKMEKFGMDGIELSISNPMGESLEVMASSEELVEEMTRAVVSSVKIPVMVKLSQNSTSITKVAKAAKRGGASAVSAINTVRCILGVDTETGLPSLPTYGGYSGTPIRPLGLASVAALSQTVDIPVCGVGGIDNYENALEYIMLGASAVQVGTAIMLGGMSKLREIVEGLDAWGIKNQINQVGQIRGKSLEHLRAFDEVKVEPLMGKLLELPCREGCEKCMPSCIYGAIYRIPVEDRNSDFLSNIEINREECTGCGLCVDLCPEKKIVLDW